MIKKESFHGLIMGSKAPLAARGQAHSSGTGLQPVMAQVIKHARVRLLTLPHLGNSRRILTTAGKTYSIRTRTRHIKSIKRRAIQVGRGLWL